LLNVVRSCHPRLDRSSLFHVRHGERSALESDGVAAAVDPVADDECLVVVGVAALNRTAVERLYQVHRDEMFRFAVLVAGDRAAAEDAVQEAFARVYRAPERVEAPERALAYVRTIVLNLLRTPPRLTPRLDPSPMDDSTERTGLARIDQSAVAAALASLSVQQRACVVCRYYLGMSDREVAEALGLSLGTAKTHLRRALRHLRTLLGEHHEP
jgi:RNA polymerase sigma factor (sigma-70 family)